MSVDKIKPGSTVNVKIVKRPTNESARKTLVRVLWKDADMKAEDKLLTKLRVKHYTPRNRGGRLYSGHMKKLQRLKGEVGESGTVRASVDVINDLKSVSSFIEVNDAK